MNHKNGYITGPRGIKLTTSTLDDVLFELSSSDSNLRGKCIHFLNAYSFVLADRETNLQSVLRSEGSINLVDSFWLSKLLALSAGRPISQVRGPSVFENAMLTKQQSEQRHFLLGGSDDVLESITKNVSASGSAIVLAGSYAPPFADLDQGLVEDFIRRISLTKADIVWVGLGTPKQDYAAFEISRRLNVTTICVGAAFDFLSGRKSESPKILTSLGLEWLFRLVTEPRRLWKRYLLGNFVFLAIAFRFLLRGF